MMKWNEIENYIFKMAESLLRFECVKQIGSLHFIPHQVPSDNVLPR